MEKDEDIVAKEVSDLLKSVKDNNETAQSKQEKYYDAKHGAGLSFKLNALVLKKEFRRPKWKGGSSTQGGWAPIESQVFLERGCTPYLTAKMAIL